MEQKSINQLGNDVFKLEYSSKKKQDSNLHLIPLIITLQWLVETFMSFNNIQRNFSLK